MGDFLQFLRRLLKNAAKGEAAVFGVCLGCHAIAAASLLTDDSQQNDAAISIVRTSPNGIEVGVRHIEDMRKGCDQAAVEFHYEEIDPAFIERANATLEFTNAHSTVQGFSLGQRIRAMQFHPEFDADDNAALLQHNKTLISSFFNIPRSPQNPKILRIDDTEIVGDRIAQMRPIPGHFLAQEIERRPGEVSETGVAFVVRHMLMHDTP